MSSDYMDVKKQERELLHSLSAEIDEIFFVLRKKYQMICREMKLLRQQELEPLKMACLDPLDEHEFLYIIERLPALIIDSHIDYMIRDKDNNIFKLIRDYNNSLQERARVQEKSNGIDLMSIDEKVADSLQHIGAMIYHLHIQLHIHLNLLNILIRNEYFSIEAHEELINTTREEYLSNPCAE